MKAILAALLLALTATAFGSDGRIAPTVLGYLETQNRMITFYAGIEVRYTVRTKEGKVLAEKITAPELRACFPELAQITDATVVAWAGL